MVIMVPWRASEVKRWNVQKVMIMVLWRASEVKRWNVRNVMIIGSWRASDIKGSPRGRCGIYLFSSRPEIKGQ